jgi:hypothetical protein
VPSVFVWPRLALTLDPPWPPALIYPARGVAALWEKPGPGSSGALGRLLAAPGSPGPVRTLGALPANAGRRRAGRRR